MASCAWTQMSGSHFLLQGIFPTQREKYVSFISYIGRRTLYHQHHLGNLRRIKLFCIPCYQHQALQTVFCLESDVITWVDIGKFFFPLDLNTKQTSLLCDIEFRESWSLWSEVTDFQMTWVKNDAAPITCVHACMLSHFSCVQLCDPMTVAYQAPLSMGFSK